MKKRFNFLLLLAGVFLFIPFHFLKGKAILDLADDELHLLGVAAMIGMILMLIGLINLSSLVEIKFLIKDSSAKNSSTKKS